MQKTIPSLATHPFDDVAAYTIWHRLGPDSISDVLPHLTNPRRDAQGVMYFDFTNANIRKFNAEQCAQEGGPQSPVYDMLVSPGHLYRNIPTLKANSGGICAQVCYEMHDGQPDGLLKITAGNRHLNERD